MTTAATWLSRWTLDMWEGMPSFNLTIGGVLMIIIALRNRQRLSATKISSLRSGMRRAITTSDTVGLEYPFRQHNI